MYASRMLNTTPTRSLEHRLISTSLWTLWHSAPAVVPSIGPIVSVLAGPGQLFRYECLCAPRPANTPLVSGHPGPLLRATVPYSGVFVTYRTPGLPSATDDGRDLIPTGDHELDPEEEGGGGGQVGAPDTGELERLRSNSSPRSTPFKLPRHIPHSTLSRSPPPRSGLTQNERVRTFLLCFSPTTSENSLPQCCAAIVALCLRSRERGRVRGDVSMWDCDGRESPISSWSPAPSSLHSERLCGTMEGVPHPGFRGGSFRVSSNG